MAIPANSGKDTPATGNANVVDIAVTSGDSVGIVTAGSQVRSVIAVGGSN